MYQVEQIAKSEINLLSGFCRFCHNFLIIFFKFLLWYECRGIFFLSLQSGVNCLDCPTVSGLRFEITTHVRIYQTSVNMYYM